ncbi:hypothetical protein HanPSC8_Chr01g0028791 [Helianthus annuus]|nr:hypothetical protein HanPSC8_Chr10g0446031 [Helianthus annuus]KAJ0957567.1 hypothetical protein HanPSC8_Chr01g0028791 [Helianthus annuus]
MVCKTSLCTLLAKLRELNLRLKWRCGVWKEGMEDPWIADGEFSIRVSIG